MFITKNKMLLILGLLTLTSILALPILFAGTVLLGSVLANGSYYALTQYDIDFNYWFSFVGQLFGLIFFVVSFLMIFTYGASLISP